MLIPAFGCWGSSSCCGGGSGRCSCCRCCLIPHRDDSAFNPRKFVCQTHKCCEPASFRTTAFVHACEQRATVRRERDHAAACTLSIILILGWLFSIYSRRSPKKLDKIYISSCVWDIFLNCKTFLWFFYWLFALKPIFKVAGTKIHFWDCSHCFRDFQSMENISIYLLVWKWVLTRNVHKKSQKCFSKQNIYLPLLVDNMTPERRRNNESYAGVGMRNQNHFPSHPCVISSAEGAE